jgi:hypothetical protein
MQYYDVDHFVSNSDALKILGDQGLREILDGIIYIIPKDVLDDVLSNCVFFMLSKKCPPAFFIHNKLIEGKNICVFSEILYSKKKKEQIKMILHEIAHYVLDHSDERLSDEEYYKQEKKANSLTKKWIDDYERYLKTKE